MSKKESVEFQIYKSDVMNAVKSLEDDNISALAESILGLGEESHKIGLVLLGSKLGLDLDEEDLIYLGDMLEITRKADKDLYDLWVSYFICLCSKYADKKYGK